MNKGRILASVGESAFELNLISEHTVHTNGTDLEFDLKPLSDRSMSLILSGKTYTVELVPTGRPDQADDDGLFGKTVVVSIKGREYTVLLDDARSLLFRRFATKSHADSGNLVIRAPMPGLISKIEVRAGEEISKGQGLLVLEAMKMENEIRSTVRGKIKTVHAEKGKPVEKGEPLLTIEAL